MLLYIGSFQDWGQGRIQPRWEKTFFSDLFCYLSGHVPFRFWCIQNRIMKAPIKVLISNCLFQTSGLGFFSNSRKIPFKSNRNFKLAQIQIKKSCLGLAKSKVGIWFWKYQIKCHFIPRSLAILAHLQTAILIFHKKPNLIGFHNLKLY